MSFSRQNHFEDELLLQRISRGDKDAFSRLYDKYWEQMYSDAYKRLKDSAPAQDIVQEIFAYIWTKRDVLRIENLPAYLKISVRNRVLKQLSRQKQTHPFFSLLEECTATGMNADKNLMWKEFAQSYEMLLSSLPSKRQLIFRLRFQNDLPTREIANQLGLSRKTVQNQLNKAVEQLRLSLLHIFILLLIII